MNETLTAQSTPSARTAEPVARSRRRWPWVLLTLLVLLPLALTLVLGAALASGALEQALTGVEIRIGGDQLFGLPLVMGGAGSAWAAAAALLAGLLAALVVVLIVVPLAVVLALLAAAAAVAAVVLVVLVIAAVALAPLWLIALVLWLALRRPAARASVAA